MRSGIVLTTLAALLLPTGMAASDSAAEDHGPFKVQKTSIGTVLADPNGMTLYTFDKDTPGKSACVPGWHAVKEDAD
jgi:predicted lipoprotein with Yx(FWY)xxD motif